MLARGNMTKNALLKAVPFSVEQRLNRLGANLRIARLRRNITLQEAGRKIGVSRFVVSDAEKGKPSTAIAVYIALLWAYDLLGHIDNVAEPTMDEEGMALSLTHERQRAGSHEALDNDF